MKKWANMMSKWVMVLVLLMTLGVHSVAADEAFKTMEGDKLEQIETDKKAKDKYLVIDVRPVEDYQTGHLLHAINLPVSELKDSLDRIEAYKDKPVIVYCNTDKKSTEAANILVEAGFKDVTRAPGLKQFEYSTVTYHNILPDELIAAKDIKDVVFVDAREVKDFEKSSFPNALSANAEKPEEILAELPENKATPIYVYCYSGNRSSVVAQKIKDAGYENVYNAIEGTKEFDYPLEEK